MQKGALSGRGDELYGRRLGGRSLKPEVKSATLGEAAPWRHEAAETVGRRAFGFADAGGRGFRANFPPEMSIRALRVAECGTSPCFADAGVAGFRAKSKM